MGGCCPAQRAQLVSCDDLEGWGGRGREAQEGRNIYICESVKVKVAQSCLILQPHGLYSPWNSPGQNTGVGSLSLLQGIFPTQESSWALLHCRQILYQLSYQGSPYIYTHTHTHTYIVDSQLKQFSSSSSIVDSCCCTAETNTTL